MSAQRYSFHPVGTVPPSMTSDPERDGIVERTVYPQVPPKVEYRLTEWGQAMWPALDSLLEWAAARPT
jgi:DNA-binding HxlR family transcriptional regulator